MSTNNKHKVSEKELDNLLGQAFLNLDFNNPKNQELMETISDQVMHTAPVSMTLFNKSFFAKLISVIIIVATSLFIYFNYFNKNDGQPIQSAIAAATTTSTVEQSIEMPKQEEVRIDKSNTIETTGQETVSEVSKAISKQEQENSVLPKQQITVPTYVENERKAKLEDTSYVFPKLTEKEIKETKRQKLIIAMCIVKPGKSKFLLVPKNYSRPLDGNTMDSINSLYIQDAEVSNLEYRTFLFDLILQGRKAEFMIAKPHQNLWLNTNGTTKFDKLKDLYFSDKRFNDYPVVNITPEGAELYCKWLMEIGKQEHKEITARLPSEREWRKAASSVKPDADYPWGTDSIQNKRGCYMANFCIKKLRDQLNTKVECDPKKYPQAYTSAGLMLSDTILTAKIYSYNPNDYKLYCLSGNVAEMVYDTETGKVITKGGSWNSDFEHCRVTSEEELADVLKANPMTGFRPMFRLRNRSMFGALERENPKTGLSTITADEIKTYSKEKSKILNQVVKLNKDKYVQIPTGSADYKNSTISVQSFYMETTEVTNLEYRTFLADLLIQNRTDDYLVAKPNQQAWITKFPYSFNEPMTNMYFWHPAYDEYPVVNISRKGAALYCEWLTIEANKILKENNKPLINDLRIPDEYEWVLAASNKKNYAKYANGNEFLRDSKGKYEMNYMCYSKDQCRYDSVMNLHIPKKEITGLKDKDDNPGFAADGVFHTGLTKAYNSNSYGLYGMAGNASEMIINHKTGQPETKGGSWFSCDHYLQIDAEDEYKNETKASPLIGFRPVFTAPAIGK